MEDLEVLTDGTDLEELGAGDLGESAWYGTGAGNTIILPVTATPSPMPVGDTSDDLSQHSEIDTKLLETLESINEKLENDGSEEGKEVEDSGDSEGQEGDTDPDQEEQQEPETTLEDLLTELQSLHDDYLEFKEVTEIHYNNSELYQEFTLGFLVSMFFGFVIYCFLGRLR